MRFRKAKPQPSADPGTVNGLIASLLRLQVQNMGDYPVRCDGQIVSGLFVRDADDGGREVIVV